MADETAIDGCSRRPSKRASWPPSVWAAKGTVSLFRRHQV